MSRPSMVDLYIVRKVEAGEEFWMFGMRARNNNRGSLVYSNNPTAEKPITIPWMPEDDVIHEETLSTFPAANVARWARITGSVHGDENNQWTAKVFVELRRARLVSDELCRQWRDIIDPDYHSQLRFLGLSIPGPPAAGPSTTGPSAAGPSTAGPSTAGPSTAGPSTAGVGIKYLWFDPDPSAERSSGDVHPGKLPSIDEVTEELEGADLSESDLSSLRRFRAEVAAAGFPAANVSQAGLIIQVPAGLVKERHIPETGSLAARPAASRPAQVAASAAGTSAAGPRAVRRLARPRQAPCQLASRPPRSRASARAASTKGVSARGASKGGSPLGPLPGSSAAEILEMMPASKFRRTLAPTDSYVSSDSFSSATSDSSSSTDRHPSSSTTSECRSSRASQPSSSTTSQPSSSTTSQPSSSTTSKPSSSTTSQPSSTRSRPSRPSSPEKGRGLYKAFRLR